MDWKLTEQSQLLNTHKHTHRVPAFVKFTTWGEGGGGGQA